MIHHGQLEHRRGTGRLWDLGRHPLFWAVLAALAAAIALMLLATEAR